MTGALAAKKHNGSTKVAPRAHWRTDSLSGTNGNHTVFVDDDVNERGAAGSDHSLLEVAEAALRCRSPPAADECQPGSDHSLTSSCCLVVNQGERTEQHGSLPMQSHCTEIVTT